MFIRFTRLLLIILSSIFLGMCIVWWVMYTTSEPPRSTAMLSFGMIGAIVLILAIVFVQFLENKRAKKQQEKLEKQNAAAAETEAEIDKNRV